MSVWLEISWWRYQGPKINDWKKPKKSLGAKSNYEFSSNECQIMSGANLCEVVGVRRMWESQMGPRWNLVHFSPMDHFLCMYKHDGYKPMIPSYTAWILQTLHRGGRDTFLILHILWSTRYNTMWINCLFWNIQVQWTECLRMWEVDASG